MSRATFRPVGPVHLAGRFPALHAELMALLRGLAPEDWTRGTACARWSVKDVAAHLLDGSLRRLSFQRDGHPATPDVAIASYADLVGYLNRLNAEWVTAARRISPALLIHLLDQTGREVSKLFAALDPDAPALFAVAWAGEERSANWFDVAREYTERWLHQQQIRDAVGAPGLIEREWLHPVLDIFLRALPHSYRQIRADPGTQVLVSIEGRAGGDWTLVRDAGEWRLHSGVGPLPAARVRTDQDTAWRLFTKALSAPAARERIRIEGDQRLGEVLLGTLAVMG